MNTGDVAPSLARLFAELVNGAAQDAGAYILNRGDAGLLRSLDRISAEAASAAPDGGACIAAHVDHVRYGLSLMNRWAAGENPFGDANWSASWDVTRVSDVEWASLRADLRRETERWAESLRAPREVTTIELNGMIASVAHLAYHLGAIRQIDRSTRGPAAND